jgi:hypothetical protein
MEQVADHRDLGRWSEATAQRSGKDVAIPHGFDPFGARVVLVSMSSVHPSLRRFDPLDPRHAGGKRVDA